MLSLFNAFILCMLVLVYIQEVLFGMFSVRDCISIHSVIFKDETKTKQTCFTGKKSFCGTCSIFSVDCRLGIEFTLLLFHIHTIMF